MTGSPLLDVVAGLVPELAERSAEIEAARRFPADLAQRMAGAGLFRMLVPVEHGGLEVHAATFVAVVEGLARADAAAGWVTMIGATTASAAASLDEQWATSIYGEHPAVVTVGVAAPLGRATRLDGGQLQVTGRWPWGSGCQVADWITGGTLVEGADGGPPEMRLLWFRADEVTIEDTWYSSGLCGSGSAHFSVTDLVMPADRGIVIGAARPRFRRPLYAFPIFGLLSLGVCAVALGIGRRAIDELTGLAPGKVPMLARSPLSEKVLTQVDLARAEGQLRAARALVFDTIDRIWARAAAGERFTVTDRADLRLAATWAAQASAEVVERMYRAAGGTAVYRTSPLQRALRDVNTVTQHAMVQDETYHTIGRILLDLPVDVLRF